MTDLARARDLALASASDLARTLASEFDHAITLVVNLANAHDLASTRELASALAHASDLALTSASDLARALARASTNDLVGALASARVLASALASDLACALTKVSFITIELARIPDHPYKTDFILFRRGITGKGRTIAIIDFDQDPTISHDLHVFDQYYGLPDPTLNIFTPEGTPSQLDAFTAIETTLDVEYAHVIAPDATINLVLVPWVSVTDIQKAVAFVVDNNLGDVLSQSYGLSETSLDLTFVQAVHQSFVQATKKRITLFAASGDTGAAVVEESMINRARVQIVYGQGVLYPASDPLMMSVGGTTLYVNSEGQYMAETAWNNSSSSSPLATHNDTGGGFSDLFPQPAYQNHIPGIGHYRVVTATGCGVLLNVTNVFINATNHHFSSGECLLAASRISGQRTKL